MLPCRRIADDADEKWLKQHLKFLSETEWQQGQFWIAVVMFLSLGCVGSELLDGDFLTAGIYGTWTFAALILGALRREHRRREVLQRRYFHILCRRLGVDENELRKAGLWNDDDRTT